MTRPTTIAKLTRPLVSVAFIALVAACAHGLEVSRKPLAHATEAQRRDAIRHARVWAPTDVPSMNLRVGPQGKGAFQPLQTVTCDYVDQPQDGRSPKFSCALTPDDVIKVKYGEDNGEVYGEVASTRLLWALGFSADRMYPVRVVCRGCSRDPHRDRQKSEGQAVFEAAAVERKMPGEAIESRRYAGWAWPELDNIDETAGGSSRAERDALKLLAVMIQHTDNKLEQQRLICLPSAANVARAEERDGSICPTPFMLVSDLGLTFGSANLFNRNSTSSVNFDGWSSQPIWEDREACRGHLPRSWTGSMGHPRISEGGRKFLADLLAQLSDAQLRDLFEVSRFPLRSGKPVDEWVSVFKKKRNEIANVTCPS